MLNNNNNNKCFFWVGIWGQILWASAWGTDVSFRVSMSCWSLYRHYDVTCDAKNKNLKESNKIAKEKKNDAVRRSWFHVGKSPKRAFTRFRKILHSWVMLTWHVGAQKCSDFTAATADVSASEAGDHIHRRLRRRPHFLTPKYLYTFANLQNTTFLKVNKYIYIFFKNKVISFFFCLSLTAFNEKSTKFGLSF